MNRVWLGFLLLLAVASVCLAADKKVEAPADCQQCGMNRTAFSQSRMLVTYMDGSSSGICSINCAVSNLQKNADKEVKTLQVGDFNSKKLIDARKAVWVIGGKKQGVMSAVGKWAFVDEKAAAAFLKINGGKLATFDEVLAATKEELAGGDKHKGHGEHKM